MKQIKQKLNGLPITVKAATAFMIASVLERAIQMITSPIFTRLLTTAQYGTVSLFNSYVEIIGLFALLSLSSGIFNNGMLEFEDDRDSYIASNLALSHIATLVTLAAIVLIKVLTKDSIIPFDSTYLGIMFALFLVKPAYRFWLGRARYEYKYKSVLIVSVLLVLLSSAISIATIFFVSDKALGRILGRDATFFMIYSGFYLYEISKGKIKKKYMKFALRYSLPLLPYYLSKYVLNHFDQVMIANMVDRSSAGIYSVAYTAGFAIKIVWEAINSAVTPWIYGKLRQEKYCDINRIVKQGFCFYTLLTLMVCLFAPEIMKILAPQDYYAGIYCIPPVVCGTYFVGINAWFSIVVFYHKKSGLLSNLSLLLAGLNIGLNYIGILFFGYAAAAYTTMICYAVQCFLMFLITKKLAPGAFDGKFTLLLSIATVSIALLTMILYQGYLIRYALMIVLGVVAIMILKKIISIDCIRNKRKYN